MNYANAVKAIIVYADRLLVLKNADNDPYRPSAPDFPGGRLNPGESPYDGLKREIREELGDDMASAIEIGPPADIQHFTRDDGQTVTMMFFRCYVRRRPDIILGPEHGSYNWVPTSKAKAYLRDYPKTDAMIRAFNYAWYRGLPDESTTNLPLVKKMATMLNDTAERVLKEANMTPTELQTKDSGVAAFFGTWPGNETDEEMEKALYSEPSDYIAKLERVVAAARLVKPSNYGPWRLLSEALTELDKDE